MITPSLQLEMVATPYVFYLYSSSLPYCLLYCSFTCRFMNAIDNYLSMSDQETFIFMYNTGAPTQSKGI